MKVLGLISLIFLIIFGIHHEIQGFCGFYVARADAKLFNQASRVVMVRNKNRTVIGMMNDYKGKLKDFALVVPVPVVLKRKQIHIGDAAVFDHLDAFTAPRLVEYYDENPCRRRIYEEEKMEDMAPSSPTTKGQSNKDSGVTVEASYTIGEYDIKILSAKYSNGLEKWLRANRYKIPRGASKALQPYIRQNMKFFVAKVNLKEKELTGLNYLRPIQFAFESEKFMLPIRLGMINSDGVQELLIYILTRKGRVESTNYRSKKLPSNQEVPEYIKSNFANFYKAMFQRQVEKEGMRTIFTEYFWNMGWCDPCAANPLSAQELQSLGVFWLDNKRRNAGNQVMVTRLHLKYNDKTFPEDLMFQETNDSQNFQGRYIIQHPWRGNKNECSAAEDYFENLTRRKEQRLQNLHELTGWQPEQIRKKMGIQPGQSSSSQWWQKIWN